MPSVLAPEDYQSDAAANAEVEASIEGPGIFLDPSALSLLPGDVTVLTQFVQFLRRDILQERIPASKIEIRGSVDPEEDTSQVVVRVWIRGLADSEIRRYHHELGGRVDRWTGRLPEAQRLHFIARLSFQARRDADA